MPVRMHKMTLTMVMAMMVDPIAVTMVTLAMAMMTLITATVMMAPTLRAWLMNKQATTMTIAIKTCM